MLQNKVREHYKIEAETKQILDTGDGIADRRARIQAEREKVVANQKAFF